MHMWAPWVGTFLPQIGSAVGDLQCTGIAVEGAADGEYGRRGVAHGEHSRDVIFVISNARELDLLLCSKKRPNEPITRKD